MDALPCTNQSFTKVAETDCFLYKRPHRCNFDHILVMKANISIASCIYLQASIYVPIKIDLFVDAGPGLPPLAESCCRCCLRTRLQCQYVTMAGAVDPWLLLETFLLKPLTQTGRHFIRCSKDALSSPPNIMFVRQIKV